MSPGRDACKIHDASREGLRTPRQEPVGGYNWESTGETMEKVWDTRLTLPVQHVMQWLECHDLRNSSVNAHWNHHNYSDTLSQIYLTGCCEDKSKGESDVCCLDLIGKEMQNKHTGAVGLECQSAAAKATNLVMSQRLLNFTGHKLACNIAHFLQNHLMKRQQSMESHGSL